MNFARIRAIAIVGVLVIAAIVIAEVARASDKQSHASYANNCPAGSISVTTAPLPEYQDIKVSVYNGSNVAGQAQSVADELAHRGFKVQKLAKNADKPITRHIADIYYGPKTVAAAWVVRAEFVLTQQDSDSDMHFNIKSTSDTVQIILGTNFLALGSQTQVNQAIAALKTPPAPPGTCAISAAGS